MKKYFLFFLVTQFCLFSHVVQAQKKRMIRIMNAESMENGFSPYNGEYQRLIKKVYLKHEGMRMWCDSAHYFALNNQFTAYGRVRIRQGDSILIKSRKLIYDGKTRIAQLRNKVVYKDDSTTLYTDFIDYDLKQKKAVFINGGKIVDSDNTLTSDNGIFSTDTKSVSFSGNTLLTTKEAEISADTLQYNTSTNIAQLLGPTKIKKEDGSVLTASSGEYNTKTEKADFEQATINTSENMVILGDHITPNEKELIYEIKNNVSLVHKIDSVVITGDYAFYSEKDSIAYVVGNPVMRKIFKDDTLYVKADTLLLKQNPTPKKQNFFAYNNVKILRKNMSGIADSLVVQYKDSSLFLYKEPVLWFGDNQAFAEKIFLNTLKSKVDKFTLNDNALLLAKDSTSAKFNQLKGKNIIAHFRNDSLDYADVLGNAESILLVEEEDKNNSINNTQSKNMRIIFEPSGIKAIKSYVNVEGKVIPFDQLKKRDTRVDNFKWLKEKAPTIDDIYPDGIPSLPIDIFLTKEQKIKKRNEQDSLANVVDSDGGILENKKEKIEPKIEKETLEPKKRDELQKETEDKPSEKDNKKMPKEENQQKEKPDKNLDKKSEQKSQNQKENNSNKKEDEKESKIKRKQQRILTKQKKLKQRIRKKQLRKEKRIAKKESRRNMKKLKKEEKLYIKIEKTFAKKRNKLIKKAKKNKQKSISFQYAISNPIT